MYIISVWYGMVPYHTCGKQAAMVSTIILWYHRYGTYVGRMRSDEVHKDMVIIINMLHTSKDLLHNNNTNPTQSASQHSTIENQSQ